MSSQLTWTSSDRMAEATVEIYNRDDIDGSITFQYWLYLENSDPTCLRPKCVAYGFDLKGPITDGLVDALRSLASFLDAWEEATAWGERTGQRPEIADLFPTSALEWTPWIEEFAESMTNWEED